MALFYETTPWLIPKADDRLIELFRRKGTFYTLNKGSVLSALNTKGDGHNITMVQSGLLAQCYDTDDKSKPHAISLVLPGRIINYFDYLGIDNRNEKILVLRDTDVRICRLDTLHKALKEEGLEEEYRKYCMACIGSDYGAFTCMFSCQTEERLGHLFLSLARSIECRTEGDELHIPLKLTYTELSYIMFSTVKTIERIMAKWHKEGVLISEKGGFCLSLSYLRKLTKSE